MARKSTTPSIGAPTFEVPEQTREGKSSVPQELLDEMSVALQSGDNEWVSDNVAYPDEKSANKVRGAYRRAIRKSMGLTPRSKKFRVRTVGSEEDGFYFLIGLRSDEEAAKLEQKAADRRAAKAEQTDEPTDEDVAA